MFNKLYDNAIDVARDRGPVGVRTMSFTAIADDDVAGMVAGMAMAPRFAATRRRVGL